MLFGAAELWLDRRRADRLSLQSRTLRRFQPPSLTKRLAEDPAFLMKPVRQKAAVIFIDLSGFTGLSELLPLDETREMLRGFHALVDQEAVRHQGIVASFMGDGAMILFGLPDSSPEDACHAVEACVGLCRRTEAWMAAIARRNRIAARIQDRRPFRGDHRIPARRRQPSAHHGHRRYGQCGEPVDGSRRLARGRCCLERRPASRSRRGLFGFRIRSSWRERFQRLSGVGSGSIPIWLWRRDRAVTHMRSGSGERHRSPF